MVEELRDDMSGRDAPPYKDMAKLFHQRSSVTTCNSNDSMPGNDFPNWKNGDGSEKEKE